MEEINLINIINKYGLSILKNNNMLYKKLLDSFSQKEASELIFVLSDEKILVKLLSMKNMSNEIENELINNFYFSKEHASYLTKFLNNVFSSMNLSSWKDSNFTIDYFSLDEYNIKGMCYYKNFETIRKCFLSYFGTMKVINKRKTSKIIKHIFSDNRIANEEIKQYFENRINEFIQKDLDEYFSLNANLNPSIESYYFDNVMKKVKNTYGISIKINNSEFKA